MPETSAHNPLWCPKPLPDAAVRLVCFPHAGGGPSTFRAWSAALAPTIEVSVVTLAGRANRAREPFAPSMDDAVAALLGALESPGDNRVLALFGHSLGAIVAYETAHELAARGNREVAHLFVSGSRSPNDLDVDRFRPPNDNETLIAEVERRYGAIPAAVRSEPELLSRFLPVLRADLKLLAEYTWTKREPSNIPVTAFAGTHDLAGPPHAASHWQTTTNGEFAEVQLPGDHFFVHSALPAVAGQIRRTLGAG